MGVANYLAKCYYITFHSGYNAVQSRPKTTSWARCAPIFRLDFEATLFEFR